MRLQSSVEFLTTYSFLFLLIGIVMSLLLFSAASPRAILPSQCVEQSGPHCNTALDYSNRSLGISEVTFSFVNSESVTINVTGISTTIGATNSISGGSGCTPTVVYPGGTFTCLAVFNVAPAPASLQSGYYSINALYCNSALSTFPANNCASGINVRYGGTFSVTAQPQKNLVFSVMVLQGPASQYAPAYMMSPNALPSGWNRIGNGEWTSQSKGFAFGTPTFQGVTQLGLKINPFLGSVSSLNGNGVACASSYNSVLSVASTMVYIPPSKPSSPFITAYRDNGIEVYYKTSSNLWANVLQGSAWSSLGANGLAGSYGPKSISLTSGINYLGVAWYNSCGDGAQVVSISGLTG
ncbi:MAG: hypothetical protein KGH59_04485 [Candidatus Micrarchaeota archaeon]|nr:hypothetical protein [Candidatus Micrarchaeota archaeon]MDE1805009.1 hypothetical protein [Candidatus Micrarchaeota archaeon]MDE1847225.1 hypothetical protein [Candidatus Micrarchaeota archaeon]